MPVGRLIATGIVTLVLVGASPSAMGQRIVREGRVERLVIVDGESKEGWSVTEATLELTAAKARSGRALLFHIPVDWHAGEPKYPIGWPRCWLKLPEGSQDWRQWERLRVWIYADTSRDTLPSTPLGLIVTSASRSSWSRSLTELRKGQWVSFEWPLDQIPDRAHVQEIKFFISESRYRDGDVVDFYIDDMELVRYRQPTITKVEPVSALYFADEPAMGVNVEVLGIRPGQQVGVKLALKKEGRTLARGECVVQAGRTRVTLRLPPGLPPGDYVVEVQGEGQALAAPVRLVDSPWEGGR